MYWTNKETEKPNYGKIIGITLAIIAGVAAIGFGIYFYCKKKGIRVCICKSGSVDDEYDDDFDSLDFDEDDVDDLEVKFEDTPAN